MDRNLATFEKPLLNQGIPYVPDAGRTREDDEALVYDADSFLNKQRHKLSPMRFNQIYENTIRYFTVTEKLTYRLYLTKQKNREEFYRDCSSYLRKYFPNDMEVAINFNAMMTRINTALFQYDVLQPLIDDPDTSDIKICKANDIRVRVKGKAYKSNVNFIDDNDLVRFVESLAIRNNLDIFSRAIITFTDKHDENYILRFTISSPFVCSEGVPLLHIRKVAKVKKTFPELIQAGMLNNDVMLYLIDRAKASKGIIFAGPPGSGKSTALNAWIEYIPKTREVLVIQENDELFTNQSGFMFKHVTHGFMGEPICTLEDLGKMALVEGCNQFIIGEVKGGEMRYAATLLNAGGYFATTLHATNAYEVLDKGADLVKYGSTYSFNEARRMLKTIDTIVYMEGYKVREILECTGFDDETQQFKYTNIYRYEE